MVDGWEIKKKTVPLQVHFSLTFAGSREMNLLNIAEVVKYSKLHEKKTQQKCNEQWTVVILVE